MKNIIERIAGGGAKIARYLPKAVSTRLLVLALGLGLATTGWAATPVAAWTDFRNLTSGDYTWTVGGNSSVDPNTGVLTIGTTGGLFMENPAAISSGRAFTLVVEAEIPSCSEAALWDYKVGSHGYLLANNGTITQRWSANSTTYGTSSYTAGNRQLLTLTYKAGAGTHTYINGTGEFGDTGLHSSTANITLIGIGCYEKTQKVASGMKIYSVRLYNSKLSASDVSTDYSTYGVADYVTTVSSDTTLEGSDLTWKAKDGTSSTTAPTSYTKLDIRGSGKVTSSSAFNSKMNICSGVVFKPTSVGTSAMFTGSGSVVYNNAVPGSENTCYTNSTTWTGTVWIENKTGITKFDPKTIGNAKSTVKLSGAAGYFINANNTFDGTLEVSSTDSSGTSVSYGLSISDGYSGNTYTINKLTGDGLISDALNNKDATPMIIFNDASEFSGSISLTKGRRIRIGTGTDPSSAKQIAVCSGSSVTVASGKTWQADGGIIVNGTLTLADSTSTLTGTVTGSGTIVGGGTENVPNIASLTQSGWTGTVEVNGADTIETMSGSSSTQFMNSGSTFKVASGYAALTSAAGLTGKVSVNSGAALFVVDSTADKLSFGLGTVEGQINISVCSALTTLTINVGTERSITRAKLQLPSSSTLSTVNVVVGEAHGDGGSITLTSTDGLPAVAGRTYNYSVLREDGETVSATLNDGVLTYDPAIGGPSTIYDITFKNNSQDVGKSGWKVNTGTFTYTCGDGMLCFDTAATFNNDAWDDTTGLYLRCTPYIESAASRFNSLNDFTTVVVGQMSAAHNTIFIHLGSSNDGSGLVIATTDNDNEVVIAKNTGTTVDFANGVKAAVPNAATARHAYVIVKSGSVFNVWVDDVKRGSIDVGNNFALGTNGHAGLQVGKQFGGSVLGSLSGVSSSDTGVINVIRIFDYAISESQAQTIFSAYPYVPLGGLYTRTITADTNLSATDAWTKSGGDTTCDLPEGATVDAVFYNPSATLTVDADATLVLDADLTLDKLTVGSTSGSALSVVSDGSHSVQVSDVAIINSLLTITYGAVNLAGTPVQLGKDATLCFDCSALDLSGVYQTTRYQLTGLVDRDDVKITAVLPTAPLGRAVALEYNNGYYEIVATTDHTAGSDVYYTGGYWGTTESTFAVTNESGASTIVLPGDTVVIPSYYEGTSAYFGSALPANVAAISVAKNFAFESGVDDMAILGGATVTVAEGCTLAFATSWHNLTLGAVTFDGPGSVSIPTLTRTASIAGALSGTAVLTISGTVNVASGGSIANAVAGSGTIAYAAIPATRPSSYTGWTGTVALPAFTGGEIALNNYGVAGSTVRVSTSTLGYLVNATVLPTIELGGDWTLPNFSASFANEFTAITGSGTLTLGATLDVTAADWYSNYSAFLKIGSVAGFSGSITLQSNGPGIVIGGAKPAYREPGGKILVYGNVTVGETAIWTAPNGVILVDANATLVVPSSAKVPVPTTTVPRHVVKATTVDGTTTYSVVAKGFFFMTY